MGTRMEGKVAIITGATLGLGKAGALAFAREGASVVICDRGRTPENSQKVLAAAEGLSGEIAYKRCDVMIKEDISSPGPIHRGAVRARRCHGQQCHHRQPGGHVGGCHTPGLG